MAYKQISTDFLHYLASTERKEDELVQLPSLTELSEELGVSVARLREQLEVARALGLVEVKPRTGIRRQEYSFSPAVLQSLSYAMELDQSYFFQFADLRNHLEAAYWFEAVEKLTAEDIRELQKLMARAWEKLNSPRVQIPHYEHRQLHMTIFRRLDNQFVQGMLVAYWEAYEKVGLNLYSDFDYLQQVWGYHQQMVNALSQGDYQEGYRFLIEHKDLLHHRSTERPAVVTGPNGV